MSEKKEKSRLEQAVEAAARTWPAASADTNLLDVHWLVRQILCARAFRPRSVGTPCLEHAESSTWASGMARCRNSLQVPSAMPMS